MNIWRQYLYKRAKDKRTAQLKERKRLKEQYERKSKEAEDETHKMTTSPCAIQNNQPCSIACVHFKPATVGLYCWYDGKEWIYTPPKCKLWSK